MKMESQIHLMLVDAVTKNFEKILSHRQMMTSQQWLRNHLTMTQHFLKIFTNQALRFDFSPYGLKKLHVCNLPTPSYTSPNSGFGKINILTLPLYIFKCY